MVSLAEMVHPDRAALVVYDMQVGIVQQLHMALLGRSGILWDSTAVEG
jgi:hypothetical protein